LAASLGTAQPGGLITAPIGADPPTEPTLRRLPHAFDNLREIIAEERAAGRGPQIRPPK